MMTALAREDMWPRQTGHRNDTIPFPCIPDEYLRRFELRRLSLRALTSSIRGLDIDFADAWRPRLITEILRCCTVDDSQREIPQDFFLDLTVGTRTECLLQIAILEGCALPTRVLRCADPSCRTLAEIELPLTRILALRPRSGGEDRTEIRCGKERIKIRLPKGSDLYSLAQATSPASARCLVERLLLEDADLPDEVVLNDLEAALSALDPLIDFSVCVQCPECGSTDEHPLDLQELALELLDRRQRELLAEVHLLAAGFHWSERDILALPSWRRRRYTQSLQRRPA